MFKKSSFRGPLGKSHSKRAKTPLKSGRQHLYQIYWSEWSQFRFKNSLWVIFSILGLFVKPLTANNKYFLLNRENFYQYFQMQLSQKRKIFNIFFFLFPFSKFRFNLEHFQKKDDPHSLNVFLNWRTPKNVVR